MWSFPQCPLWRLVALESSWGQKQLRCAWETKQLLWIFFRESMASSGWKGGNTASGQVGFLFLRQGRSVAFFFYLQVNARDLFFCCVFFLSCMGRVPACVFGACVMSAVGCDAKHLCVCVAFNLRRSCYACSSLFLSYLVHVPMLPAVHLAPACLVPSLVPWDVRAVSCSHLGFPGCVYRPCPVLCSV